MLTLLDLAPETLLKICESLCLHCQCQGSRTENPESWSGRSTAAVERQALVNLSLVSRRIGHIAQGVLYHHFGFLEQRNAIFDFCRTISENQRLGSRVRMIQLSRPLPIHNATAEPWFDLLLYKHWQCFTSQLRRDLYKNRYMTSVIPVLTLFQTPRLQQLWVDCRSGWHPFVVMRDYSDLHDTDLPRDLASLHIRTRPEFLGSSKSFGHTDISLGEVDGFASHFSRLEALTICGTYMPSTTPTSLSIENLRSLRLIGVFMNKEQLRGLVSIPRSLEGFEYDEVVISRAVPATWEFEARDIVTSQDIFEALQSQNDTLRHVVVRTLWRGASLTALAGLTNLHTLKMNARAICDAETLAKDSQPLPDDTFTKLLPASLQQIYLEIGRNSLICMKDALICYLDSTYRRPAGEQTLKHIVVDMRDRETAYQLVSLAHTTERAVASFSEAAKERSHQWLENGCLAVVRPCRVNERRCTSLGSQGCAIDESMG